MRRDDVEAGGDLGADGGLTDDALRSMLEGRASRVTASDARAVLASARAEIAGPSAPERGGLSFATRPVAVERRRAGVPWRLAALAMAAVVAIAVLGTAANPRGQRSETGPANSGAAATSATPTSATPTVATADGDQQGVGRPITGTTLMGEMSVDDFATALQAGELDGKVVLVDARLRMIYGRCGYVANASPSDCTWIAPIGHESMAIARPATVTPDVVGAHGSSPGPVALRVEAHTATLLGWVVGGYPQPMTVADVTKAPAGGIGDVQVVAGYLAAVDGQLYCRDSVRCPANGAWLSDDRPATVNGELAVSVDDGIGMGAWPNVRLGTWVLAASQASGIAAGMPRRVVAHFDLPSVVEPGTTPPPVLAGTTVATPDLQAEAWSGRLAGKYVVVTGRVVLVEGCRQESGRPCYTLWLAGPVELAIGPGDLSTEAMDAAIAAHPDDAPMVLRGDAGSLSFVGWLAGGSFDAVSLDRLTGETGWLANGEVAIVDAALGRPHWETACAADGLPGASCKPAGDWPYRLAPMIDWVSKPTGVTVDIGTTLQPVSDLTPGPYLVSRSVTGSANRYLVIGRMDGEDLVATVDDPVSTPTPSGSPRIDQAGTITATDLAAALKDGSIDGRIVLATGTARFAGDCGYQVEPCSRFSLDGAPDLVLTWDGQLVDLGADTTTITHQAVSGTLVLVPQTGHLVLLGRAIGNVDRPGSLQDVFYRREPLRLDPFALDAVTGWVINADIDRCASDTGIDAARPCARSVPVLTDREPADGAVAQGAAAAEVAVAKGPGLDPATTVIPGPFLGRYVHAGGSCADPATEVDIAGCRRISWTVVARYNPGGVLTLGLP